jgi:hypothetical protein
MYSKECKRAYVLVQEVGRDHGDTGIDVYKGFNGRICRNNLIDRWGTTATSIIGISIRSQLVLLLSIDSLERITNA